MKMQQVVDIVNVKFSCHDLESVLFFAIFVFNIII